jgi:cyclic-di-AMP phosphodiesterase PgpH
MKLQRSANPLSPTPRHPPAWRNWWGKLWAKFRLPILLGLTLICLTGALGHRFYNMPQLAIGKISAHRIPAPTDATLVDPLATEAKRKAALSQFPEVLRIDQSRTTESRDILQQQINQGDDLRQRAGAFPFAPTDRLSLTSQAYLRQASTPEWQGLEKALLKPMPKSRSAPQPGSALAKSKQAAKSTSPAAPEPVAPEPEASPPLSAELKAVPAEVIAELERYRQISPPKELATLRQVIVEMRSRYATAVQALPVQHAGSPSPPLVSSDSPSSELLDAAFLNFSETDWQQTKRQLPAVGQRILTQGISPGIPAALLREAINLQIQDDIPLAAQDWARQVLLAALQPNLVTDDEQTRLQQERAAQDVQPVEITIRQGEVIVAAGQRISPEAFKLLDHFQLSQRALDWWGLAGFSAVVSGAIALYWGIERRFQPKQRRRDRLLILLLILTTPLLIALRVPSTNLPAIGILVGSFYGSPLGATVAVLLTALLALGMELPLADLLPSAAAGILCGIMAGRLRTREELALLGTGAGILQGGLYLAVSLLTGGVGYRLLGDAAIHGLLGLAWSVVAIGSSPYLEQVFDLVTTVRLVELANPNRPLLKRLAAEAPGTFQHTLLVATLAEAAARALGCNVELVRTGTLYHDIGKMHDPQGFIENQMGGPNKHDRINDPWKSADIIKRHVTEGLVMARRARLPKAVQAFIPEHQGTMLVAYFYHQAQQRSRTPADPTQPAPIVREEDFRYAGPDPQSRETGIVMVADACEAALRSLKSATPEEALSMINKILRARWQEQQLIHSGLTRPEMDMIAKVFVQTWQQFNHQRIAYPKAIGSSPALPTTPL